MKKEQSYLGGSKIWKLISDILSAISTGKRPAQSIYFGDQDRISVKEYRNALATAYSIR